MVYEDDASLPMQSAPVIARAVKDGGEWRGIELHDRNGIRHVISAVDMESLIHWWHSLTAEPSGGVTVRELPGEKPDFLCAADGCRYVALDDSPYCRVHAAERAKADGEGGGVMARFSVRHSEHEGSTVLNEAGESVCENVRPDHAELIAWALAYRSTLWYELTDDPNCVHHWVALSPWSFTCDVCGGYLRKSGDQADDGEGEGA